MNKTTAIEARLKELLADELGINEDEVTRDAAFLDDLGADSIDCVEIVLLCEEEFGIEIPDETADRLTTFGALVDYVQKTIRPKWKTSA